MDHNEKLDLIQTISSAASNDLPFQELAKADALNGKAKLYITRIFGPNSDYLKELQAIRFVTPLVRMGGSVTDVAAEKRHWERGRARLVELCRLMVEDLQLSQRESVSAIVGATSAAPTAPSPARHSKKVFIVHGHDAEMKEAVARALAKLELESIILHEQPDQGRTEIEKFVDHSDVGFAVVLLSGDDHAFPRIGKAEDARPRARQNVILELGFFLGKLGRNRVLPFYRKVHNFELPSDYDGVLYKEFDSAGAWKVELFRELKAAGYEVDANKLM